MLIYTKVLNNVLTTNIIVIWSWILKKKVQFWICDLKLKLARQSSILPLKYESPRYTVHVYLHIFYHYKRVKSLTTDLQRKCQSPNKGKINLLFFHKGSQGWDGTRKETCVPQWVDVHCEMTGFGWQQLFSCALSLCSAITEGSVAAVIIIPWPFVLSATFDHYCCFLQGNCSHLNGYVTAGSH